MKNSRAMKLSLMLTLLLAFGQSRALAADEDDYGCARLASAYRKALGAQAQLAKIVDNGLSTTSDDIEVIKDKIMDGLTYRSCPVPANLTIPAKAVSLVVDDAVELSQLNKCPHHFFLERFVSDAAGTLRSVPHVYHGYRAAAEEDAEKLLTQIKADIVKTNCQ